MIRIERENDVIYINLHRPRQRNALSFELLAALQSAFSDPLLNNATAVILSGDGGIFSAGADLFELTGTSEDVAMDSAIAAVVAAIEGASIPVVAWVDGPCVGGAVDIMLACDIRVASLGAWFQVPATRLGLLYNPVAVARMHAELPRETLTRMLTHGERFDAREALAAGLLTHLTQRGAVTGESRSRHSSENIDAATLATSELLDALDSGDFDHEAWEQRRRDLLDSADRALAISAARAKRRG